MSDILAVVIILVSSFERWGWRWHRLHPRPVGMPVIRGTWRGMMESSYVDPATGTTRPAKVVYLAIRQTLTTVWVRFMSDESASNQVVGSVKRDPWSEDWLLSYTYQNTPKILLRQAQPGAPRRHLPDHLPRAADAHRG